MNGAGASDTGASEGGVKAMAARLEAKDEERPPVPIKRNRVGLLMGYRGMPISLCSGFKTAVVLFPEAVV